MVRIPTDRLDPMRKPVVLILGLLLTLLQPAWANDPADARLRAARGFMGDGLYRLAVQELEMIQLDAPGSAAATEALFLRAQCQRAIGADARADYHAYLQRSPRGPHADEATFRLGEAAQRRGDGLEASRLLGQLLDEFSASPFVPHALLRRSRAARGLGDEEQSSADLERILLEFGDEQVAPYARHDLAVLRLRQDRPDEAVALLQPLLKEGMPEGLTTAVVLEAARAHLRIGEPARTVELLRAEKGVATRRLRGEALIALGRHEEAAEELQIVVDQEGPASDAAYSLAWCFATTGAHLQAEQTWVALADAGGSLSNEALLGAAESARELGRLPAAEAHCRRVEDLGNGDQRARAHLCRGLLRPDEAVSLTLFEHALAEEEIRAETRMSAQMARGNLLLQLGRPDEAAQAYGAAAEAAGEAQLDPADAEYGRAVALLRAGRPEEVVVLTGRDAGSLRSILLAAEARVAVERWTEAESEYRQILEASLAKGDPLRVEALFGIGWCRLGLGETAAAIEWFDRVVVEAPRSDRAAEALLRMGDALTLAADDAAAEKLYGLYLQRGARGVLAHEAHLGRARALLRMGDLKGAAAAARAGRQSAAGQNDAIAEALVVEARARFDGSDFAAAESLYLAAAESAENETIAEHAVYRVGDCRFNALDPVGAAEAYASVINSFPAGERVGQAVQGLYWAAAESKGKVDAAEVVSRALDLAGDKGGSIALHEALILRDRGQDEEARDRLGSLVQRFSGTAEAGEALYTLGAMSGKEENAAWRTLVRDFRGHARAPVVRRRLAEHALAVGEPAVAVAWMQELPLQGAADQLLLGLAQRDLGELEEARELLEVLTLLAGDAPEDETLRWRAIVALALVDYAEGKRTDAEVALQAASADAPEAIAAEAQYRRGEMLYAEGAHEEALRLFLRIRYLQPGAKLWIRHGELAAAACYEALGDG